MRSPSSLVVVALIGLSAGCSRGKPVDSNHFELVLDDAARRPAVVSALELGGEARTTPAASARSGAVAPLHARRKARTRRTALTPKRAPEAEHAPAIAAAPAPATPVAPAPAPRAPTAPEPAAPPTADPQPGQGRGGWSAPADGGGVRIPGIPGGVIIIRGGHSGMDPCDEHGRGGLGGIIRGLPGRIGRGSPGGIVFLRGR